MSSSEPDLLARLRAARPEFGFAVYAYEPGGPVTLEVLAPDGQTYEWQAHTMGDAIARAFPRLDLSVREPVDIFS